MKSGLAFALATIVLGVGGCGGFSVKRSDDSATGGEAGAGSGGGGTAGSATGGTSGEGGTSGTSGTTSTGGSDPGGCRLDSDCGVVLLPCAPCPGGGSACPSARCVEGQCQQIPPMCPGTGPCEGLGCGEDCQPCVGPDCPPPEVQFRCNTEGVCTLEAPGCFGSCTTIMDCPIPPPSCEPCPGGSCQYMDCVNGGCEMVCDPRPLCMTAMECPGTDECRLCPGGGCAAQECIEGRCDFVCPL
jgi:hypothetical protein